MQDFLAVIISDDMAREDIFVRYVFVECEKDGQSIVQYTVVLGIVAAVCLVMGPMLRRFSQGMIKVAADQIGYQSESDQSFDPGQGYMEGSLSWANVYGNSTIREFAGTVNYIYGDKESRWSKVTTDLGFSK